MLDPQGSSLLSYAEGGPVRTASIPKGMVAAPSADARGTCSICKVLQSTRLKPCENFPPTFKLITNDFVGPLHNQGDWRVGLLYQRHVGDILEIFTFLSENIL